MDIYLLENNHQRNLLLEHFESFIWTERRCAYGDFEITFPERYFQRNDFWPGRRMELIGSNRLMIIKNVEKRLGDDGNNLVKVSGKSLESVLDDRATSYTASGEPHRWINANPGTVISALVRDICVNGVGISPSDVIPNLSVWSSHESSGRTDFEVPIESLYKTVKEIAESDGFGFRITFDPESKDLVFQAYKGTDRSRTSQVSHPLVFSPEYDNLFETSYLRSTEDYKTSAYVVHSDRSRIRVVHRSGQSSGSGFGRRVIVVNANDIDEPTNDMLDQRGRQVLAEHNYTSLYDGTALPTNNMVYNEDYHLGDIVVLKSEDGQETRAIVDEYIWTYDHNGLSSYPTFIREEDL